MLISVNSCLRKIGVAWIGVAVLVSTYQLLADGEMLHSLAIGSKLPHAIVGVLVGSFVSSMLVALLCLIAAFFAFMAIANMATSSGLRIVPIILSHEEAIASYVENARSILLAGLCGFTICWVSGLSLAFLIFQAQGDQAANMSINTDSYAAVHLGR